MDEKQKEELFLIFSNRVNELMKKEGIEGITELAKKSNISQSTLSTIMNKKRIPKLDVIVQISKGLNLSVQEFFDIQPFNENTKTTEINSLINGLTKEQEKLLKEFLKTIKKD